MRIVVTVESGECAGRKIALGPDKVLSFGREHTADFCCGNDPQMSRVHFRIETDHLAAYAEDLKSRNGTFVNDEPIEGVRVLRNGDRIRAGANKLRVEIEGDSPDEAAALMSKSEEHQRELRRAEQLSGGKLLPAAAAPLFTIEKCESGLTLYRDVTFGQPGQSADPALLAVLLGQKIPLTICCHFQKIALPFPQALEKKAPLFDFLPEEIAMENSPIIFPAAACPDVGELIQEAWDQDALICIYSRQDWDALVQHLRGAARLDPLGGTSAVSQGGFLGFCWPSVLSQLLAFQSTEFVTRLMAGIEAVLIEMPDLPDTWQIFGNDTLAQHLEAIGLRRSVLESCESDE